MTSPLALGFLKAAKQDIAGAEHLFPGFLELAAFHAQQAAEKLARAVCLHEGLPDLRTHDIARIAQQLEPGHPLGKNLAALGSLTAAATAWRYPNAAGELPMPPEPDEIQAALKQIKIIRDEIRDWLAAP